MNLFKVYASNLYSLLSVLIPYQNLSLFEWIYSEGEKIYQENVLPFRYKLMFLLYVYEIIRSCYCDLFDLSHKMKIILFDYFDLISLPKRFNLAFIFIVLQFACFYYYGFFHTIKHKTLELSYTVLVRKQTKNLFLSPIWKGKTLIITVAYRFYMFMINFQQLNTISLIGYMISTQGTIYSLIVSNWNWFRWYHIVITELNAILVYFLFGSFINIINFSGTIGLVTIMMHFIMLDQVKRLLKVRNVSVAQQRIFTRYHTKSANYQKRIHQPALYLIHLSVRSKYTTIREQIYLSNYIQMLHVEKKYGVTYAGMALITMLSFFRNRVETTINSIGNLNQRLYIQLNH
ncbi:hypothetical protein BLOT_001765 [Blomia tropicalis]|nr:hypothetical protein BLOT_001765 [Blomia tropicalis]